ncbi:MAG: sulfate ABC transporter ATP-binding protein [Candidatus Dormiibacterota bacterium]
MSGVVIREASKRFGPRQVLDRVSLEVPQGKLFVLLGPSGGGKSTLLRVIAGLERPDSGSVLIDGEDVTDLPARSRDIGFCFQHYAPFRHLNVFENVAFGLRIRRQPATDIRKQVGELLDLVRLQGEAANYPSQLSGGQLQRMALARALAVRPRLLLLDEPFGALDATVRKELRAWLRSLHDRVQITTVLVTHDQDEAMEVADRLAIIDQGRMVQEGSPAELYEEPANDFVFTFLGPATRFRGAWVRPHDLQLGRERSLGSMEAQVSRVVDLGFEVRVELSCPGEPRLWVQLARSAASELNLQEGGIVWVSSREAGERSSGQRAAVAG